MILCLIRIYFQPAASLVPTSHTPLPCRAWRPEKQGKEGEGRAGKNLLALENFPGQGEERCPPLAACRESGQRGCWSNKTVKKSHLAFLGSREGWLTGAASQAGLLACCVILGSSYTLSDLSFLICFQQVFKGLSGYDFRTIATCLSGSQFGSHWVGSREVP